MMMTMMEMHSTPLSLGPTRTIPESVTLTIHGEVPCNRSPCTLAGGKARMSDDLRVLLLVIHPCINQGSLESQNVWVVSI